jgi:hypothetical protein
MTSGLRIAIVIPTTGRCGQIVGLESIPRLGASMIVPQGDYRPVQSLSQSYDHLTQSGGVLDRFLDTNSTARYQLTVKDPPETGKSWEVPVALAHWARHAGHQIVSESPDLVIWATGSLDANGGIVEQDYHVAQKIAQSAGLIQTLAGQGAEIAFLLPYGQGQDSVAALGPLKTYSTHQVKSLPDAVKLLEASAAPVGQHNAKPKRWRKAALLATALAASGVMGLAFAYRTDVPPQAPALVEPPTQIAAVPSAAVQPALPDPEPELAPSPVATDPRPARTTPHEDVLFAISILPKSELWLDRQVTREMDLRGVLLERGFALADIRDLTCTAEAVADHEIDFRIDPPCMLRVQPIGHRRDTPIRYRSFDATLCFEEVGACTTVPLNFAFE